MPTIALDVRRGNQFGFGTYIRNLTRALAAQTTGPEAEFRYLLLGGDADFEHLGALPSRFELTPLRISEASPRNIAALYFLLRRRRADVLHVPHYHWIPQHLPCPHLVTVHDLVEFALPPGGRSRLVSLSLRSLVRRSLRRAARVVAVSQATRRDVLRFFRLPPERVEVVYNAIDERLLAPPPTAAEMAAIAERYAVNHPFLLYVGDVRPHKNVERLIEAFAALKAELARDGGPPDLKLVIIGDEVSRQPRLRRAVVRRRLESEARFLGFVPFAALRFFYAAARVFVFPSRYEGFGFPPLEAMAQGTPVVTSNLSSLPEVVNGAAVLVNPENVYDIMRGMRRALLDDDLRARLARDGPARARQFRWEHAARRMAELYAQAAASRRGRAARAAAAGR